MGTNTNFTAKASRQSIDETRTIMDSFRKIVRGLRHSSQQSERLSGLTSAQFFVLQQIKNEEGLSLNTLADLTFTHQSTVSEIVARLVTLGLVSKLKSKIDSRKISLVLTSKGSALVTSAPKTAQ